MFGLSVLLQPYLQIRAESIAFHKIFGGILKFLVVFEFKNRMLF